MTESRHGKRTFVAAAVATVCGIIAACVGDDPEGTTPAIDAGGGGGSDGTNVPGDERQPTPSDDAAADVDAPDSATAISIIATAQKNPTGIVVDGEHVYWINQGDLNVAGTACDATKASGSVMRAKVDGSNVVELVGNITCPSTLSLGPDAIYYGIAGDGGATAGSIWRVPKLGGTAVRLYDQLATPRSIVVEGDKFWFTDDALNGRVVRGMADGGTLTLVARDQVDLPRYLNIEGAQLVYGSGYYAPSGSKVNGILRRAPKDANVDGGLDGASTQAVGPFNHLGGVTTTQTHAFIAYSGGVDAVHLTTLARASLLPTGTMTTGVGSARGIATDGAFVYIVGKSGSVVRVSVAGGPPERFAVIDAVSTGVAVDATHVYVTSTDVGLVRRVKKPTN